MYSRSIYATREDEVRPPENYVGNTFRDIEEKNEENIPEEFKDDTYEANADPSDTKEKEKSVFSSLFSAPIFRGLFGNKGLPFLSSLSFPKIGTEEILIIAAAVYLFFSKDGDRQCAIMLLLLLLVN